MSYYDNGGIIGKVLDLGATEQYIVSSTLGTPSFVGAASKGNSYFFNFTIAGLQENDLLVLFATQDSGTRSINATNSPGWTTVRNDFQSSILHIIAHKTMGSTVDSSIYFTSGMDSIILAAFRDVSFTSLSSAAIANGTSSNPPAASVVDDNSIVLALSGLDDDSSTVSSGPSGYTLASQNAAVGGSAAVYYKTGVSSGTEDPSSLTWNSSDQNIALTAVLSRTSDITYGNVKNSGIWSLRSAYENEV